MNILYPHQHWFQSGHSIYVNQFYDLRILVFEQINKFQTNEFMYRFNHNVGLLPSAFSGYFSNVSDIRSDHSTCILGWPIAYSQKIKIVKVRLAPLQSMPIIEIKCCAKILSNWITFSGGPRAQKVSM